MKELALHDSLSVFLREIDKYPVLSREEEHEIALEYKNRGDLQAARKLIVSNLKFVVKIASEYVSYGFSLLDLVQEGTLGLMRAVKKFDPDKGYRLISYAVWWIRVKIQNFIMKSWSVVKIGTTQAERKMFQKLGKAKKKLEIKDDGFASDDAKKLADLFDVREKDVLDFEMRMASRDFSLDAPSVADESVTYIDAIEDYRGENPEEIIQSAETKELEHEGLKNGMEILSERERQIVERRFFTEPPYKLRELSDELGISKERVRQIESQALKKLRSSVESNLEYNQAHLS